MLERSNRFKTRIGEIVELKAVTWLAEHGYEVYLNIFRTGPADLVMVDTDGNVKLVDVKKIVDVNRPTKINQPLKTEEQNILGVQLLYYNESTDFFGWTIEDMYKNVGKRYISAEQKNKKKQLINEIIFDREFNSLGEIAEFYNINYRSLAERQRRKDETLEQSVAALLQTSKSLVVLDKWFSNRKEACRYYNVNSSSVEERMRTKNETVNEVVTHFIERNRLKEKNERTQSD